MEATYSSETLVDFQDKSLHNHRCENLKSYMGNLSKDIQSPSRELNPKFPE
jgi:hypothetical protein